MVKSTKFNLFLENAKVKIRNTIPPQRLIKNAYVLTSIF